jgi:phosphoserine phosphatase RsbU/P
MSHASRPLVWITDDSPVEAKLTQRALGTAYDFEYFADGAIVLERLAGGGRLPDVLLLDWVMPGVSGDEVCRFLRAQPRTAELPIIIVTASRIETQHVVEGLSIGANDYVPRPFVDAELRARVDSAIRAKRLRETAARERNRLMVINKLGRAFVDVGPRLDAALDALASTLVDGLCDGCSITVIPGVLPGTSRFRHRSRQHEHKLASFAAMDPCVHTFVSTDEARQTLPAAYHPAIDHFGMSAFAVLAFPARSPVAGIVTLFRDGGALPFDDDDIVTIETCLEYAALAFEKGLRFDAEQTTRKQLQTIVEHLPISIVVADASGALTHVNQTALQTIPAMRGAHSIDEAVSRITLRDASGMILDADQVPLRRALAGEQVRGVELQLDADGDDKPRHVRASAVPLADTSGTITSAILAFDDITVERLANDEREQASEFQRYVLGIVSHDLRSPLQALLMGCEGIKLHGGGNPKVVQFIQRMESTTTRMRGIIEQLLDVVRAQLGGGIPVTPADSDLKDIVTSVLGELTLANPGAELEQHLEPVRGHWDRDRLAQVAMNLVGNALQHGQKHAPVRIETTREGDLGILRVSNRSVKALTEEQMAGIFAPFRRTKQATSGSGGLGLGLFIASEIVRAHGGEIRVVSTAETTTFSVCLPLAAP